MMELIEKRDAYHIIKDMIGLARLDVLMDACDTLKNLPTIDAVPVRHGKWEVISVAQTGFSKRVRCPYCKKERIYATNFDNYCPNCGARMDGKEI